MMRNQFTILLIAVVLAIAAVALLIPGRSGNVSTDGHTPLFEGLGAEINEANRLLVTGSGDARVTLTRGEKQWTIGELNHYPADWNKLRTLLGGLSEALVRELKTSNPEYYSRLGVDDVSGPDARGVLLELSLGEKSRSLIVGDDAGSRDGQYVRLADEAQSVLIDRGLDVSTDPLDWADQKIVDIGAGLVAEVEIIHPDGDFIRISKVSADDSDFSLENLPEGREIASSWSVNSLGGVFSQLDMDGVQPDSGAPADNQSNIRVLTFSGLELHAELLNIDGESWLRVNASAHEQRGESESEEATAEIPGDAASQANEINQRVQGWMYRLRTFKSDMMKKRLDELLKPVEDSNGEVSG